MRRNWKCLVILIWMTVFYYQHPYIAHVSFTIFLEKEAFRRLLIINQTTKFSFNFLVG
jgi:hypothetical protein